MDPAILRAAHLLQLHRAEQALITLAEAGETALTPAAWLIRTQALIQLERITQAIQAAAAGMAAFPDSAMTAYAFALAQFMNDDLQEAETALLHAIHLDPDDPDSWELYARCCALAGQHDKSMALLDQAAALDPEGIGHIRARAWCVFLSGQDRLSRQYARQALSINPLDTASLNMLGSAQLSLGEIADSHRILGQSVREDPRNAHTAALAFEARLQSHWSMAPLRLFQILGPAGSWLLAVAIMIGLNLLELYIPLLVFAVAYVVLVVWSWIGPGLIRRLLRRQLGL